MGKKRILEIAGGFRKNADGKPVSGGVPSFLYNYCTAVDEEKYSFDFLSLRNQCFAPYEVDFNLRGWKLYSLNLHSNGLKRMFQTILGLRRFLVENKYDSVHINMGSFFPVLSCAIAAKSAGVKNVIAHSHSTGIYSKKKRLVASLLSPLLTLTANKYCACSKAAAENLFSKAIIENKKYCIIRNAIDIEKYSFNENQRLEIRHKYGIKDSTVVVGHVGRFVDVKNHAFLIEVFNKFLLSTPDSLLILIGDGELRPYVEKQVKKLGIEDKVLFLGQKKEVYLFYSAMDCFILPSLVEGLGIVAIEAQASGLPCLISSRVPAEAKISDTCEYFDISSSCEEVSRQLRDLINKTRDISRINGKDCIKANKYDLESNITIFERLFD